MSWVLVLVGVLALDQMVVFVASFIFTSTRKRNVMQPHENQAGCPLWPGCGCGTQGGSQICKWRHTSADLQQIINKLRETIIHQEVMIRSQKAEIARLQPLGKGNGDD